MTLDNDGNPQKESLGKRAHEVLPSRRERVIVVGCGHLGASVAAKLSLLGRDVCVIDLVTRAFRRLDDSFGGFTDVGDGTSAEVLERNGIEEAAMVLALATRDNDNICIGAFAAEVYGVPEVYVRLHDRRKADLLEQDAVRVLCPRELCEEEFSRLSGIKLPGDDEL